MASLCNDVAFLRSASKVKSVGFSVGKSVKSTIEKSLRIFIALIVFNKNSRKIIFFGFFSSSIERSVLLFHFSRLIEPIYCSSIKKANN
jgi:hypothetical protein